MTRQEWLEWRKGGIGGSDVPIILGVSPWKTIEELYQEKISDYIIDTPPNFAQERGIRMEPRIRSLYEMHSGESFKPGLKKMEELPYMLVSLDGESDCKTKILEIKVSGKEDWHLTKQKQIIPKKYYPQIQHALFVSQAKVCLYLSYLWTKEEERILDINNLAVVEVFPDIEFQKKSLEACSHFWNENVLKKISPTQPKQDHSELCVQNITEWKYLQMQITELEKRQEFLRNEIINFISGTGECMAVCNGVQISQVRRAGNVDYSKIDILKTIDLEQYRKPESVYWKLEINK